MKKQKKSRDAERIPWHPAFYAAAEFDLRANKDDLTFIQEHQLNKEPLRIDLLVIKKKRGAVIQNEMGHFFRGYNIIEYKSPDDALTIDDFYKTMGYACFFKSLAGKTDAIHSDDITISLFRESYPRKLTETLNAQDITVTKTASGIYHLKGQLQFPAQIVVMKELTPETGPGMRILSRKLKLNDLENFFKAAEHSHDAGDVNNINAILHVAERANHKTFQETMEVITVTDFLEELIKDRIEEREARSRVEGEAIGRAEAERKYQAQLAANKIQLEAANAEIARLRAQLQ